MRSERRYIGCQDKTLAGGHNLAIDDTPICEVHEARLWSQPGDGDGRGHHGRCLDRGVESVILLQPVGASSGQVHAEQPGHHSAQHRGREFRGVPAEQWVRVIDQLEIVGNVVGGEGSGAAGGHARLEPLVAIGGTQNYGGGLGFSLLADGHDALGRDCSGWVGDGLGDRPIILVNEVQLQRVVGECGRPEHKLLMGGTHRAANGPGHLRLENGEQKHAVGDSAAEAGPRREHGVDVDGIVVTRKTGELVKLFLGESHRDLRHSGILDRHRQKCNDIWA